MCADVSQERAVSIFNHPEIEDEEFLPKVATICLSSTMM
jgi:hypothetical protein